jgi:hypothetical protein
MSRRRTIGTALTVAAVSSLAMLGLTSTPTSAVSTLSPPPASAFTAGRVTNPYFPLKPGTRWVYRGTENGTRTRDVVLATGQTIVIQGVTCRVVRDRLYEHGRLAERTRDYYAQTKTGTVWYFGEDTAELDKHGNVTSTEGSFRSGRDGARAGIFMPATPRVGFTAAQEQFPGQAEDRFRILSLKAAHSVPLLSTTHAMLTKEWTPLEPGVIDHKFYVRDVGMIGEASVTGPVEIGVLVAVQHVKV